MKNPDFNYYETCLRMLAVKDIGFHSEKYCDLQIHKIQSRILTELFKDDKEITIDFIKKCKPKKIFLLGCPVIYLDHVSFFIESSKDKSVYFFKTISRKTFEEGNSEIIKTIKAFNYNTNKTFDLEITNSQKEIINS
jgi:hypothetical protein